MAAKEYHFVQYDVHTAPDTAATLGRKSRDGWDINFASSPGYPYLLVLWEREVREEKRDAPPGKPPRPAA